MTRNSMPPANFKEMLKEVQPTFDLFKEVRFYHKPKFLLLLMKNTLMKFGLINTCAGKEHFIHFQNAILHFGMGSGELAPYTEIVINHGYEISSEFIAKGNNTVIDLGANIGIYSISQGQRLKGGKVFAFEPNPVVFGRLKKNIAVNNMSNVFAFNKAVTANTGSVQFCFREKRTTQGSVTGNNIGNFQKYNVESVTLDDIVEGENLKGIDILKIDVEGSEVDVLKGGMRKALNLTKNIVLEYHSNELKAQAISILGEKGFTKVICGLTGDKQGVLFFRKIET